MDAPPAPDVTPAFGLRRRTWRVILRSKRRALRPGSHVGCGANGKRGARRGDFRDTKSSRHYSRLTKFEPRLHCRDRHAKGEARTKRQLVRRSVVRNMSDVVRADLWFISNIKVGNGADHQLANEPFGTERPSNPSSTYGGPNGMVTVPLRTLRSRVSIHVPRSNSGSSSIGTGSVILMATATRRPRRPLHAPNDRRLQSLIFSGGDCASRTRRRAGASRAQRG